MGKHLSLTLVLVLVLISIITGCTTTTIQTVTQYQTNTITRRVTETVTQTKTNNLVMTFSSTGTRSTPSFTVNSSPWMVEFGANYDITFTLSFQPYYGKYESVGGGVPKGKNMRWRFNEYTGYPLFFNVETSPTTNDNEWWTFSVIEID